MLILWIISLLYVLIDYFFKRKNRMGLWSLMNALATLLFILTTAIYVGKFIIYFWYPYFFILATSIISIGLLRLLQFYFFPFLFWRKNDLGPETYIEWSKLLKGERLSLLKMYQYSSTNDCENYPHSTYVRRRRQNFFKNIPSGWHVDPIWVFEHPKPSYSRSFVYVSGYIYIICTRCKSQIKKLECKPGTMNPLDKYIIYKEDNVY